MFGRSVRAHRDERQRQLPGDEIISHPIDVLTHAITIHCPAGDVWPWLAQMGAGSRAGWYSYDFLDNGRRPSADKVIPELQKIAVGMVFPGMPGVTEGFILVKYESERYLVLGWPLPDGGAWLTTWAFVLEPAQDGMRLITRARASRGYQFRGLPQWWAKRLMRLVHAIMQRKQLIGIARRAEKSQRPAIVKNDNTQAA